LAPRLSIGTLQLSIRCSSVHFRPSLSFPVSTGRGADGLSSGFRSAAQALDMIPANNNEMRSLWRGDPMVVSRVLVAMIAASRVKSSEAEIDSATRIPRRAANTDERSTLMLSRRSMLLISTAFFAGGRTSAVAAFRGNAIKMFDTDADGTLDLDEVKKAAAALFARLDRDHDGTLDRRELAGRISARELAAADPDHDGTLSLDEYLAIVQQRFNGKICVASCAGPASRLP
jgi:hypothetical protein